MYNRLGNGIIGIICALATAFLWGGVGYALGNPEWTDSRNLLVLAIVGTIMTVFGICVCATQGWD